MPPHTTKRKLSSCENCRQRKIRCAGGRPPCETCIRRGFASSCHYQRERDEVPYSSQPSSDVLLGRIAGLENLLKKHIAITSDSLHAQKDVPKTDTPTSQTSNRVSWSPGSETSHSSNLQSAGRLVTNSQGYTRFISSNTDPGVDIVNDISGTDCPGSDANFPFSADLALSKQSLLDLLPPMRQCDELKDVYFQVFSPLFHVLHDPSFELAYQEFRSNPGNVSLSFLALLFVILAIATSALQEDNPILHDLGRELSPSANIRTLATRYRAAAMKSLSADHFMWQHTLYTVQALILLIYALMHSVGPSWALIGTTFNIAIATGCHVDPSTFALKPVEQEERRRCWAALMTLYTTQSTCFGYRSPIVVHASVDLPADIDDEDIPLDNDRSVYRQNHPTGAPTKMTYILYKFRLYKIADEICQGQLPLMELDRKLEAEETEQISRFKPLNLPIYHVAHHYILSNYTNILYLVLHRPHLLNDPSSTQHHHTDFSFKRCKIAALKIIENHNSLCYTDELRPYRWYIFGMGTFHAFLAASTLIAILLSGNFPNYEMDSTIKILQNCLQRMQQTASRSEICRKSASILEQFLLNSHLVYQYTGGSPTTMSTGSESTPPSVTYYPNDSNCLPTTVADPNVWMYDSQLNLFMSQITSEQWLAPSSFPWDRWTDPNSHSQLRPLIRVSSNGH